MNPEIMPHYSSADAATVVGMDTKQLDSWLGRGAFRLEPNDIDARGHGYPRQWSLRTVRKLAVMAALTRLGITPAKAHAAADRCIKRSEHLSHMVRTFASLDAAGNVTISVIDRQHNFEDRFDDLVGGGDTIAIVDITRLFGRADDKLKATEH